MLAMILQAVGDAVLHLTEQGLLLLEQFLGVLQQPLLFLLGDAPLGDVLDRQQHHPAGRALVPNRKGIELEGALSQPGKFPLELETLHRHVLGDHGFEELAQAGNVPLAVGQVEQAAAVGLDRVLFEDFIETTAAGQEPQRVVEHEEGLGQGINDRHREGLRLGHILKHIHGVAPSGGSVALLSPPTLPRMVGDVIIIHRQGLTA